MSNKIRAIRNGQQRTFTKQVWDNLPKGKHGWKVTIPEELPDELKDVLSTPTPEGKADVGIPKPRKRASKK